MENNTGRQFTIKEFSKETGIPSSTLRYYEKENLITSIQRGTNGHRIYNEHDLEWIDMICCLKNTGMSIKQIKGFVDLSVEGKATLKQRCDMLIEHKKNVESQIQEMYKHLEKVSHKIAYFTKQYEEYMQDESHDDTFAIQTLSVSGH